MYSGYFCSHRRVEISQISNVQLSSWNIVLSASACEVAGLKTAHSLGVQSLCFHTSLLNLAGRHLLLLSAARSLQTFTRRREGICLCVFSMVTTGFYQLNVEETLHQAISNAEGFAILNGFWAFTSCKYKSQHFIGVVSVYYGLPSILPPPPPPRLLKESKS